MAEGHAGDNCLSLSTASHPNHDAQWRMAGSSFPVVCVACLVETLELQEVLFIQKRKVVGELARLLSRDTTFTDLLSDNPRITSHLCSILLNLLDKDNELLVKLTIELIQEIVCKVRSEKLIEEVMNSLEASVTKNKNLRMSCPHISLIGRLLSSCPPLTNLMAQRSDFLEFLLENIAFPEERIQAAVLFVLAPVCKGETNLPLLKTEFKSKLFNVCCSLLSSSKSKEVQLNSLAVLKWLAKDSGSLFSTNLSGKNFPLAGALKKVLLCTDETLRIVSTQVVSDVLAQDPADHSYAREFLKHGIGEFLFEGLESNNEVILGSLFCCFSHFCHTEIFFEGGYSLYGIESVLLGLTSALRLKNMSVIKQGLEVLRLILVNQPQTVPLFQANPTVFDSCVRVLQEGLMSPEHKVLIQATNAVEQLLQLHHMPPVVPLSAIVSLLSATMSHLRKFLKPLTSFRNIKSAVAEELLLSLLKVTKRAFLFTDEYTTRAPSYASLLAGNQCISSSADNAVLGEMSTFLINSLDQLCIPAIMVNFEDVENPEIFETFYFILNNRLSSEVNGGSMLGKKLTASSFLRLSLDVNSKFCQCEANKELSLQVSRLLKYLCLAACECSEQGQVQELLYSTSGEFPNSTSACLMFLSQRSVHPKTAEISDSSLFNMQCLCIEVLYISCIYQDMFVSEASLLTALNQYLILHPDVNHLPVITLKHLTHLFVKCVKKLKEHPASEMGSLLESHDVLSQTLLDVSLDLFEKIVTTDVAFLEWIFSSEALALKFGQFTLKNWLRMEKPKSTLALHQLLQYNPFCFQTLLSLVASADHGIVSRGLQLLEDLFDDEENEGKDYQHASVGKLLMECFHKLLLGHHSNPLQSNHLSSIIKILTAILMKSGDLDLKLVHHIVNNLASTGDSPETLLASLNFLNVLLRENRKKGQSSIGTFLLSNKAVCKTLQCVLDKIPRVFKKEPAHAREDVNLYSSTLLLVGQLIAYQMELRLSSGHVFRVPKEQLIHLFHENENVLGMAALVIWKYIFDAMLKQEGHGFVFVEGQSESQLTANDLQSIVVFIQNYLVHESETVRQTAVICLEGLLLFAEKPSQYANNPWNRIVLESQLSILDSKTLQPSCIKLAVLLLQHSTVDPRYFILQSSVNGILKRISSLQPNDQDITWICLTYIKEVVNKIGAARLLAPQRESILTWLEEVGRSSCEQHLDLPSGRNCYLTLDRTLFSAEMVYIRVSKERQLVHCLVAELRNNQVVQ